MPNGEKEAKDRYYWYLRKKYLAEQIEANPALAEPIMREIVDEYMARYKPVGISAEDILERLRGIIIPADVVRTGLTGGYHIPTGRIGFPAERYAIEMLRKEGSPYSNFIPMYQTLAQEIAHSQWVEQVPWAMQKAYPVISKLMEEPTVSPREHYPAVERHGKVYEQYAETPERMPWYMEPFYGNLMYPVPEGKGRTLPWLGGWMRSKVQKALGR